MKAAFGKKEAEHAAQVAASLSQVEFHGDIQAVAKGLYRLRDSEKIKKKL